MADLAAILQALTGRVNQDAADRDAARGAAAENRQRAALAESKRAYVRKIAKADGTDLAAVRRWFRDISTAAVHAPEIVIDIAAQTATGSLYDELERLIAALALQEPAILREAVTWPMVEQPLRTAILGPQDQATLRQELERVHQAVHESAHEFGTRFLADVGEAYPGARPAPVEEALTRTFIRGLEERSIKEELALRRAPATIREAVTAARELEARYTLLETEKPKKYAAATVVEAPVAPKPEDSVIAALTKKLDKLSSAMGELKKGTRQGDTTRRCYNCDKPGHFARECRSAPRGGGRGGGRGGYQRGGRGRGQHRGSRGGYRQNQTTTQSGNGPAGSVE